ncbi:transcription antitermination protein NusB [Aquimarina agarilytica]|uniref:transcription antitermination protein NusB n=1 Tax=Aquimarina agarilytica TaxID=1087449 RepID=UPI0002883858|nr:transcription antitermination protein NusB [Aquimarina agarilytica]
MQSLFAMKQKQSDQLDVELKYLKESMNQVRVLFIANLDLLVALRKHAEYILNANKKKQLATEAEKNPNSKFIDNALLKLLASNLELTEAVEDLKMNYWDLDDDYVKILYKEIIESDLYEEYMNAETNSFKQDRNFVLDIYKEIIAPNDKLYDYYEDKKLSWADDIPLINTSICAFIKRLKASDDETLHLPALVKDNDDILYAQDLFRKTKLHENKFSAEIEGKTPNWDKERIAVMDQIMIQLGICEFLKFPSIPVKVTINEYLEIAKEYSTPKSSIFINGILDKLSKEYNTAGTLNKMGRGLM